MPSCGFSGAATEEGIVMRGITRGAFVLLALCCLGLTGGTASAGSYYYGGGYYGGYNPSYPTYPSYDIAPEPRGCCKRGFSCYPSRCAYGPPPTYSATPFYQKFNGPCPIVLVPDGRGGWVWGANCD